MRINQHTQIENFFQQLFRKDFGWRSISHRFSVLHQHYFVRELGGKINVVRYHYGSTVGHVAARSDQTQHRGLMREIEIRSWLIQQKDFRFSGQGAREHCALTLAPGESAEVELTVAAADLGFWDVTRDRHCVESARHSVMAGRSSTDLRLATTLDVRGESIPSRTLALAATSFDEYCGITLSDETTVSLEPQAWLAFHDVQLNSETAVDVTAANRGTGSATIELRLDDPLHGELLGTVRPTDQLMPITGQLVPVTGAHTLYAVFSAADVVLESLTV